MNKAVAKLIIGSAKEGDVIEIFLNTPCNNFYRYSLSKGTTLSLVSDNGENPALCIEHDSTLTESPDPNYPQTDMYIDLATIVKINHSKNKANI